MFKKEIDQPNNESFENRLDRLNSVAERISFYKDIRYAHQFAKKFGDNLIGITVEASDDAFYVIRDIVPYEDLMALEATRLDSHDPAIPHVVKIHPQAGVEIADSKKLLFQFGRKYRQILEEINAEGKHHIEIPPKRDPFRK